MFEMVCPNKNIQKSTPNLFSLDVLAESGVERDRVMRRAMPMLLRLLVDSVHESGYTIQRDWLPSALFAGHRTMDNLAGHLRFGPLQHKARSFPIRSKRAETTYRLPGYRFSFGLPWSSSEAFAADLIGAGPMDSAIVSWSA
jgi:hypothetical protein